MRTHEPNRSAAGPASDQDPQVAPVNSPDRDRPPEPEYPPPRPGRDDRYEDPRNFPGQRWINIGLRSAHLLGVAGIGGGFLLGVEESLWEAYWWLTLISGVLLSLLYLWTSPRWAFQLKGMAVIAKVGLLAVGMVLTDWRATMFVLVVIISAFIAHAPGRVRGYQFGI